MLELLFFDILCQSAGPCQLLFTQKTLAPVARCTLDEPLNGNDGQPDVGGVLNVAALALDVQGTTCTYTTFGVSSLLSNVVLAFDAAVDASEKTCETVQVASLGTVQSTGNFYNVSIIGSIRILMRADQQVALSDAFEAYKSAITSPGLKSSLSFTVNGNTYASTAHVLAGQGVSVSQAAEQNLAKKQLSFIDVAGKAQTFNAQFVAGMGAVDAIYSPSYYIEIAAEAFGGGELQLSQSAESSGDYQGVFWHENKAVLFRNLKYYPFAVSDQPEDRAVACSRASGEFLHVTLGKCVASCGLLTWNAVCLPKCPAGTYQYRQSCVSSCPSNLGFVSQGDACEECPSYVQNNVCVWSCSASAVVYGRACLTSCWPLINNGSSGTCMAPQAEGDCAGKLFIKAEAGTRCGDTAPTGYYQEGSKTYSFLCDGAFGGSCKVACKGILEKGLCRRQCVGRRVNQGQCVESCIDAIQAGQVCTSCVKKPFGADFFDKATGQCVSACVYLNETYKLCEQPNPATCPVLYLKNGVETCYQGCPTTLFPLESRCYDPCPAGQFVDAAQGCVGTCSANLYITRNGINGCVPECIQGVVEPGGTQNVCRECPYYLSRIQQSCVPSCDLYNATYRVCESASDAVNCPLQLIGMNGTYCVSRCAEFEQDGYCVKECGEGYFLTSNKCTRQCAYYRRSASHPGHYDCEAACGGGEAKYQNAAVSQRAYECVSQCPSGYLMRISDRVCILSASCAVQNGLTCVDSDVQECPFRQLVSPGTYVCVERCASFWMGRFCLDDCPAEAPFSTQTGECVPCAGAFYVDEVSRLRCVTQCDLPLAILDGSRGGVRQCGQCKAGESVRRADQKCTAACALRNETTAGTVICELWEDTANCNCKQRVSDGVYICSQSGLIGGVSCLQCPFFLKDGTCSTSCPNSLYEIVQGRPTCLDSCGKPSGIDPAYHIVYKRCVTKCSDIAVFGKTFYEADDGTCVDSCSLLVAGDQCTNTCPQNYCKIASLQLCIKSAEAASVDPFNNCVLAGGQAGPTSFLQYRLKNGLPEAVATDQCSQLTAAGKVCTGSCQDTAFLQSSFGKFSFEQAGSGTCSTSCAGYIQDAACVQACDSKIFAFNSGVRKCISNCNAYTTAVDGQQLCHACDNGVQHSDGVCNTTVCSVESFAVFQDGMRCVSQCPSATQFASADRLQCVGCAGVFQKVLVKTQVAAICLNGATCPTGLRSVEGTKECMGKCTSYAPQNKAGVCVSYVAQFSIINDERVAVDTCPYYIQVGDSRQCFSVCQSPYQFVDGQECVYQCDTGAYRVQNGVRLCVQRCNGPYTVQDGVKICVDSCPLYQNEDGLCTERCGNYVNAGVCVDRCPSRVYVFDIALNQKVCSNSPCAPPLVIVDRVAEDHILCASSCPQTTQQYQANYECVDSCAKYGGFILAGRCVQSCADFVWYGDMATCVGQCSGPQMEFKGLKYCSDCPVLVFNSNNEAAPFSCATSCAKAEILPKVCVANSCNDTVNFCKLKGCGSIGSDEKRFNLYGTCVADCGTNADLSIRYVDESYNCMNFCPWDWTWFANNAARLCTNCSTSTVAKTNGVYEMDATTGKRRCMNCTDLTKYQHSNLQCNETPCSSSEDRAVFLDTSLGINKCVTTCAAFLATLQAPYICSQTCGTNKYRLARISLNSWNSLEYYCTTCALNEYADGSLAHNSASRCVTACSPTVPYAQGDTCASTCAKFYTVNRAQPQQYVCATACSSVYIYNDSSKSNRCAAACDPGLVFISGTECLAACKTQWYEDNVVESQGVVYKCLAAQCSGLFETDSNGKKRCLAECPATKRLVYAQECLASCPTSAPLNDSGACVIKCSQNAAVNTTKKACDAECLYYEDTQTKVLTCTWACPVDQPIIQIIGQRKKCSATCADTDGGVAVVDGRWTCAKCNAFYRSMLIENIKFKRCVSQCFAGELRYKSECFYGSCQTYPDAPYARDRVCDGTCGDDFVGTGGVCRYQCDWDQFYSVESNGEKMCTTSCGLWVSAANQYRGVPLCSNRCQAPQVKDVLLEGQQTRWCADACFTGMYWLEDTDQKRCDSTCTVFDIDADGQRRCYASCSDHATKKYSMSYGSFTLCQSHCPSDQPFSSQFVCGDACVAQLPYYELTIASTGAQFAVCTAKCPGNYSVENVFNANAYQCVGSCASTARNSFLSTATGEENTGECVFQCPEKAPFSLDGRCKASCPAGTFVKDIQNRYSALQREVLQCVEACPEIKPRKIQAYGGTQCLEACTSPRLFELPNGSCAELCPLNTGAVGYTCLEKCDATLFYQYSSTKQHYECVSACKTGFYMADTGRPVCTVCDTSLRYYRLRTDGAKECLAQCPSDLPVIVQQTAQCVVSCPAVLVLFDQKICLEECPEAFTPSSGVCVPLQKRSMWWTWLVLAITLALLLAAALLLYCLQKRRKAPGAVPEPEMKTRKFVSVSNKVATRYNKRATKGKTNQEIDQPARTLGGQTYQ